MIQTFFVATVLLLIGAVRASDDFIDDRVTTWPYVAGLVTADLALLRLYTRMKKRKS